MNWELLLESGLSSRPAHPPYFLFLAGLLIMLACGTAFTASLRQSIPTWLPQKNLASQTSPQTRLQVLIPYWGLSVGFGIVLATALEIVGLPYFISYSVGLVMTVVISWLVWTQIGRSLGQQLIRSYIEQSPEFPHQSAPHS